jgi:hypothetical protein
MAFGPRHARLPKAHEHFAAYVLSFIMLRVCFLLL